MEKLSGDENFLKNDIILNHKYNFFQQFFIIGIDPKIMYSINDYDLNSLQEPYSNPKIISKYPNENLPYLNIPDTIVASHCFPQGIINSIVEYDDSDNDFLIKEKKTESFIFSLENMCPEIKINSLRTNKVHYTCLLFYEDIENYRNCINLRKNHNSNKDVKNKGLLIPKVICLSSFKPFYEQTKSILLKIRNYVNNFNFNNKSIDNLNVYPIETIIEGLIFNLPSLPRGNFKIKINNDLLSYKEKSNENKDELKSIIFQENPPNITPKELIDYSILMKYFKIEEIFEIIKYIILEESILFFSEDIEALTNVIEGLISLIYPFQYPYPVISILPEQNYSYITLFKHFIFGINYKYSEEIINKKLILDGIKIVRVVRLEKRFNKIKNNEEKDNLGYPVITSLKADENKPLIKFDQIEENVYENSVKEIKLMNDKKKINLPHHYFEKCCRKLEKNMYEKIKEVESKNKSQNKNIIDKLEKEIFNIEIRETFLYFFCCILLKYQEYCVKYEKKIYEDQDKDGNIIEKEFLERNIQLDEKYYMGKLQLIDLFSAEEFINSTPSLDRPFYRVFFETKIFFNFIVKKIFPDSNQDKLDILYFDEIINKKLSRELSLQKKETKFLECKFDRLNQTIEIDKLKKDIDNNNLKQYLEKKYNRMKALNYFQYIYLNGEDDDSSADEENAEDKKGQLYFYYFVFPKLLNDGIFYNEKYKCNNDKLNSNKYIWSYLDYSIPSKQSNKLYDIFEEVSSNIIDNEDINKNYKLYDYSLNPTSNFHYVNKYLIKILWFVYFSITFKYIPFIKKRFYFEIIMNYFKKNIDIIEERAMLILFNSINKNGDRDMNQIFYPYMKNKTYTSYLCAREKVKSENNFIKYTINLENDKNNNNITDNNNNLNSILKHQKKEARKNNEQTDDIYKEKKLFLFSVNAFCRAEIGGNKNICGEPYIEDINELYCEDKYISFKCKKCGKEQNLIVSCKYGPDQKDENFDNNYVINFELLSPLELLRQNWLKNLEINPYFIRENYLQCYLSAIFYFYSQNLPCNFLIPDYVLKSEVEEVKNNYYSIVNNEEFFDENKIKKVVVKNKVKNKDYDENIIIFEEEDDSRRESLTFEINVKRDGLLNSSDKLIQLRDSSVNKKEIKSSLKKKKDDFCGIEKKKTVEFKLNLKKLNLYGDS